jgi:hypothetical protein
MFNKNNNECANTALKHLEANAIIMALSRLQIFYH